MFKVIWSAFYDSYIVVPYCFGMVLPVFEGTKDDCMNYIEFYVSK